MKCLLLLGLLACVLAVVCASSYNYAQAARGGRRSSSRRLSPARAAPAAAAEGGEGAEPAPEPYSFTYTSETDDGSKQVTFNWWVQSMDLEPKTEFLSFLRREPKRATLQVPWKDRTRTPTPTESTVLWTMWPMRTVSVQKSHRTNRV